MSTGISRARALGVLMMAVAYASAVEAAVGEWTSLGPQGGTVTEIAVDPLDPSILYAGTNGGVYKSDDAAATWTRLPGIIDLSIVALVIDPTSPDTVYAGTAIGVYKSTDSGESWNAVGPVMQLLSLAIDPSNPQILYAGINGGGVRKSLDSGLSWTPSNTGMGNIPGSTVAVDPTATNVVYCGTATAGIFKSTDAAATWIAVNTGLPFTRASSIAIDPHDASTLYASIGNASGTTNAVYRSTNGGASWSAASAGLPTSAVQGFAFDFDAAAVVYAATASGVYRTLDAGATWSLRSAGLADLDVKAIASNPLDGSRLYAGSFGVSATINAGQSWTSASAGFTAVDITALARDPAESGLLWAASFQRLWRSQDSGQTWPYAFTFSNGGIHSIVIDPTNSDIIYLGMQGGGVHKSTNGGGAWVSHNNGLVTTVTTLVLAPSAPSTLYAGTLSGVYKTTNAGASWQVMNSGITGSFNIFSVAVDPNDADVVYAGTSAGGLYRSTNGAASWTRVWFTSLQVWDLVIDPSNTQILYAALQSLGIHKSTNGGSSWTQRNAGIPVCNLALALDPANSSTIYCGSSTDLYRSADGALTWAAVPTTGLFSTRPGVAIVEPEDSDVLYFGTDSGGVFSFEYPTPTATQTRTYTPSDTPTVTHTPTPTVTPTETATPTATSTETPSETPQPAHTATPGTLDGCPVQYVDGCMQATKGRVRLRLPSTPSARRFVWKWQGGAFNAADLGDPTAATSYSLCIYDGTQLEVAVAVPAGPHWSALSQSRFRYSDTLSAAGGVHRILLDPTRGRIAVKAQRSNVGTPPLPFAEPVDVAVQWRRSDGGVCWESRFGPDERRRNDGTTFVARFW